MLKKIISTSVLIFLLISCEDERTNPLNLNFEIQPLKIGSSYYYVDSIKSGSNWITDSTRITIPTKTTLSGEPNSQGVAVWNVYTNGDLLRTNLINLEPDGLYHYAEINGSDTLFIRKMWAKYPVNVGDQFTEPRYNYDSLTGVYNSAGEWVWSCTSIDTQITIHNGKTIFCHIFKTEPDNTTEISLFYALNIGYTGWQVNRDGEIVFKQILTDYFIND